MNNSTHTAAVSTDTMADSSSVNRSAIPATTDSNSEAYTNQNPASTTTGQTPNRDTMNNTAPSGSRAQPITPDMPARQ